MSWVNDLASGREPAGFNDGSAKAGKCIMLGELRQFSEKGQSFTGSASRSMATYPLVIKNGEQGSSWNLKFDHRAIRANGPSDFANDICTSLVSPTGMYARNWDELSQRR